MDLSLLWREFNDLGQPHAEMPPTVREKLDQAVARRSLMKVRFVDTAQSEHLFSGPCTRFDSQTVLLDVSPHPARQEWLDAPVYVNFRENNGDKISYCQFASRIREMSCHKDRFGLILDAPAEIGSGERRSFFRITPPPDTVCALSAWQVEPGAPAPADPFALGKTPLRHGNGRGNAPLSLVNISASGLRLNVRGPEALAMLEDNAESRLICFLLLAQADKGGSLPFWLDCAVVNRSGDEDAAALHLGVNFRAWAVPDLEKNVINWMPADESGVVNPLCSWVWRRQITQAAQRILRE